MPTVDARTLRLGFEQAFDRLRQALPRTGPWESAYFALFESLDWAYAFDDYLDGGPRAFTWRSAVTDGDLAAGVRFARNRVQHHWADALIEEQELGYPPSYRDSYDEWRWRWRATTELLATPSGGYTGPARVYDARLAGQDVADTLAALRDVFRLAAP